MGRKAFFGHFKLVSEKKRINIIFYSTAPEIHSANAWKYFGFRQPQKAEMTTGTCSFDVSAVFVQFCIVSIHRRIVKSAYFLETRSILCWSWKVRFLVSS